MGPKPKPLAERFWPKVDKNGPNVRPELGSCWLWMGSRDSRGYGRMLLSRRPNQQLILAHRASWLIHHGELSSQFDVCHHCDNPQCIRPSHLFLGTKSDNMRDAFAKGRGKHCRFTGDSHPNRTLNSEQVEEIRRQSDAGVKRTELAKQYNVAATTISCIALRKTWIDRDDPTVVLHDDEGGTF